MFLKVLSYDLEILPLGEQMPTPEKCPILLCSCHFNYDHIFNGTKTLNIVYILTKNDERIEVQEERIIVYTKNEIKIINELFRLIRENDIITGYNIVNFDTPYVIDRARILKIKNLNVGLADKSIYYRKHLSKGFSVTKIGNCIGKIFIDVLALLRREDATNVFLKKYNLKKLTLEHISKEILGIEKLEFPVSDMIKYWENTDDVELRKKFVLYCSRDSELALKLLVNFRLLDKFIGLSKASGKILQDIINSQGSGSMVENLLLKEFRKVDRVMSIRTSSGESNYLNDDDELKGAFVMVEKIGVTDDLGVLDYTSLYPSLMIKHNLCYSTLVQMNGERSVVLKALGLTEDDVEDQVDEYGTVYATFVNKEKFVGIMPRKLKELLALRKSQKTEMKKYKKDSPEYMMLDSGQNASKILLNSHYGYTGDSESKVYSWYVASAVTTNGRKQIKKTIEMINRLDVKKDGVDYLLNVVMTDTDSTYVNILKLNGNIWSHEEVSRDICIWAVNYAADAINETLEKPMNLAYETYIKRIIILAKKRYAYLSIDDNGKDSITSKGIETVRRDWCNYSTDTMSKIIDFILKEEKIDDGIKKSIEIVKERAKLLNTGKIDLNELVLSKKLTKPLTHYDNKAVHVQVAIKMKERGKPSEVGDRIQYVILDNGKKLISERAEEVEYVIKNLDKFKIDKNFYLMHQLIPPAMRVLGLLGVNEELLLSKLDEKQKSLFEF